MAYLIERDLGMGVDIKTLTDRWGKPHLRQFLENQRDIYGHFDRLREDLDGDIWEF